jgi:hypothetical protein
MLNGRAYWESWTRWGYEQEGIGSVIREHSQLRHQLLLHLWCVAGITYNYHSNPCLSPKWNMPHMLVRPIYCSPRMDGDPVL